MAQRQGTRCASDQNPRRGRWLLAVALWFGFHAPAPASDAVRLVGENRRTAQRFVEAANLERAGNWSAAVDIYLAILNDDAADLVPVDAAATRWLPANWIVHRRIASSPDLLGLYRERMDAPARKLIEPTLATRNVRALERAVATMFCARPTEGALDILGDLACERGEFAAARAYWSFLVPADRPEALAFPQPAGKPALPKAKMIVARLLAGESAADELAAFAVEFPKAAGYLAGRDGRLIDILNDLAKSDNIRVVSNGVGAGTGIETRGEFPDFSSTPTFAPIPLPDSTPDAPVRFVQRPLAQVSALAFLPAIASRHALVANARRIFAFDLSTGQLSSQFDIRAAGVSLPSIDTRLPSNADIRYAATIAGDRVYARFGQQRVRAERADAESVIAALRFRPGTAEPWKLLWTIPAGPPDRATTPVFESAPLIVDGRLIAATTRIEGNRAITAVSCYDPAEAGPISLWQRDILDAPADSADRTWHMSLTQSDGRVVLGPLSGAVVALDSATGQPAWAVRSPVGKRSIGDPAQPNPGRDCLAASGIVYASIADNDCILAVDSASGALLWESPTIDAVHLIGAAAGKVFIQTGGQDSGLLALDAATGRRRSDWGYSVFGADSSAPFGRGIMLGDRICWPTRNAGVLVARFDGSPELAPTILRSLPGGNLAYADGMLLLATADRLYAVSARSDGPRQPVQARHDKSIRSGRSDDRGAMR